MSRMPIIAVALLKNRYSFNHIIKGPVAVALIHCNTHLGTWLSCKKLEDVEEQQQEAPPLCHGVSVTPQPQPHVT